MCQGRLAMMRPCIFCAVFSVMALYSNLVLKLPDFRSLCFLFFPILNLHYLQETRESDWSSSTHSDPVDPFARASNNVVLKRKGDKGGGGGWGNDSWGVGVVGGKGKGGKGFKGGGGGGSGMRRGKPLKAGDYGEVAGRVYSVLEVTPLRAMG